jgi:uncharacterized protein (DUF934 family)
MPWRDLAEEFAHDEIRVTHEQNLVLPHVALADLRAALPGAADWIATANAGLITDIIACPGLDYCALANARSIPVAQEISNRFGDPRAAGEIGDLKIKISGCINACGHHHVGHIGILGVEKKGEELYQISLGGSGDENASIGQITGRGFEPDEITDAIETIVDTYLANPHRGRRDLYRLLSPHWRRSFQDRALQQRSRSRLNQAWRTDMTVIWTQNGIVESDPRVSEADGADAGGARLLSLAEALEHAQDNAPFGVVLQPADDVRSLVPMLERVAIIALTFPAFSDGRGFSQAMLLRERLGYKGELRAIGTVLLDQVPLMLRTGFDSFEVHHAPTIERLVERRLPGIDLHYQPAADRTDTTTGYSWRRTAILNG